MRIVDLVEVSSDFQFTWPDRTTGNYDSIVYRVIDDDREHEVRIGFGIRNAYGRERPRVVIWIRNHPEAEFVGADDFDVTGDVLSEIKVPNNRSYRICRYPDEPIPGRYMMFNTVGLPTRIHSGGVPRAWAVVANIADHRTMIALADSRRHEWVLRQGY